MKSKKNFHFYKLSPTRYGHISLKIDQWYIELDDYY